VKKKIKKKKRKKEEEEDTPIKAVLAGQVITEGAIFSFF
jgi:fructose-specific phosphotransferase system IIC component